MANEFTLYGVIDKSTGKLVSNLTNPRHKYWETRKTAENAVRKFMSKRYNTDRKLEVVEIECKVKSGKRSERVKISIDIPREYERDFIADKFKDFFSRVIADIDCDGMCGNYEKEIAEMFLKAFDNAIVGDANLNANIIPVANISFNKEDMQKMIQDELKKFQIKNNLI